MTEATEAPVTIITGTRKGIGRDLAGRFLARGHRVIGCSRGPTDLDAEQYEHFELDVADESAVRALFGEVRRRYNRLDHVINNAGIASMNHALLTPGDTVRRVLETNVLGTFLFCREGAKLMKRVGFGRIVNFTTVAVPVRLEGEAAYVASKAAVESLTQVLARELAEFGITVNAVGPNPIDTDLTRSVPAEKIEALNERLALRRSGTVEDVANVVEFFLRRESAMITGQTLYIGGI